MIPAWALNAADKVLADLGDRSAIGNELDVIKHGDPETWQEIRETMAKLIAEACATP